MTEADLVRFIEAQALIYSQVVDELTNGRKRTHWMWFIFPQLTSLGHSAMAQRYAIRDLEQRRSSDMCRKLPKRSSERLPRSCLVTRQATPPDRRWLIHTDHISFFYRLIDTGIHAWRAFTRLCAKSPRSNGVKFSYTVDLCQALVAERQLCSRLDGGNP